MNRCENVLKFYVLCNKLKDVVRTGWKVWEVEKERVESVAEHIYGVQMLAIAMYKEFNYDLDLEKVLYMLAVHELEEIVIGDLTRFDISSSEKREKGKKAVSEILSNLVNSSDIENLIEEFECRETKEALFAYHCDKMECDIQAKLYDEKNCVDYEKQLNNPILGDERLLKIFTLEKSWSGAWLESDRSLYKDNNFIELLEYLKENSILK
ncbi:MAG: HD domain-containing protein [Bacilli bacterium]|nr:HD domain-containing protein [Bacilli bacterium]